MRWAVCSPHPSMWDVENARGHFKLKSICNIHNLAQSCSELFTTFFWEKPSLTKGLKTYVWNIITHIFHFSQFPSLSHPTHFQLIPSHTHSKHPISVLLKLFSCLNDAGIILNFFFWLSDYSSDVNQNCIKGLILPPLKSTVVPFNETQRSSCNSRSSDHLLFISTDWDGLINNL